MTGMTPCPSGKQPFSSMPDARKTAKSWRKKIHKRLRPYRCPDCNYWHLTSQKRSPPSS